MRDVLNLNWPLAEQYNWIARHNVFGRETDVVYASDYRRRFGVDWWSNRSRYRVLVIETRVADTGYRLSHGVAYEIRDRVTVSERAAWWRRLGHAIVGALR